MAAALTTLCRDCLWRGDAGRSRCPACRSVRLVSHPELAALTIAHVDCDAFYASVEKRDRPELRDRPVIVGGGRRGVVTTACYIARLSGVRSAMPMFKALKLCPEAEVIKPAFAKYRQESGRIMAILRALTPLVQPLSLDEAWLDLSGTERLHGAPPAATLAAAQSRIEDETGLTVSVGLAPNKVLAKIASELDKPRGFGVIGRADAAGLLAPRPVSILPGVGPVFARRLHALGIRTVGDLLTSGRSLPGPEAARLERLAQLARGLDDRPVVASAVRQSLSAETTFETDVSDRAGLEARLWPLCERIGRQARDEGIAGHAVTLKLKTSDFTVLTRRRQLPRPTQTAETVFGVGRGLLAELAVGVAYRLIGIGLSELDAPATDADLFADPEGRALRQEVLLDEIGRRFGRAVVVKGRTLKT